MIKITKSLCPECLKVIEARIFDENNMVMIEKQCAHHGTFKDVYWSDLFTYNLYEKYAHNGKGVLNPMFLNTDDNCPFSCGICSNHKTQTILANIDVTNRCNQKCPVCFANSQNAGYLYEPSFEQINQMMKNLRDQKPVPCHAVQFSGGEPTIRPDIVELVELASKVYKFDQVQIATNGIKLARSIELCDSLKNAGLNTIYLQFDGVTKEPYMITRGYNALPVKLRVIENCRKVGLDVITLVPTVIKGVNDNQLGDIIRFAISNRDIVKGINFQPVSFSGRISKEKLSEKRITIPDVFRLIEQQTNSNITANDFYTVPIAVAASNFLKAQSDNDVTELSVHPHCGAATYLYIDDNEKITPITRFVDIEGLYDYLNNLANRKISILGPKVDKLLRYAKLANNFSIFINKDTAPKDVDVGRLLLNIFKAGDHEDRVKFHDNVLFIGTMHFMDLYNMDLERVKRCGIHYATPDGRTIPFCTYNILYREEVERKFAR